MLKGKNFHTNPPVLVELKKRTYQFSTLSVYNYPLADFLYPMDRNLRIAEIEIFEEEAEEATPILRPGDTLSDLLAFLANQPGQVLSMQFSLENQLQIDSNALDELFMDFQNHFDVGHILDHIFINHSIEPVSHLPTFRAPFCSEISHGKVSYYQSLNHFFASQRD
ncbi:MAG: hypothetical protein R3D00_31460 [Bacteroidia bacterium]